MTLTYAVGALEEAAHADEHPLCDDAFVAALLRLIPCDGVSLTDLDVRNRAAQEVEPVPFPASGEVAEDAFWTHFWDSLPCSFTERAEKRDLSPRCTSDFYDRRAWHSTGMYAEYIRPAGIEWDLVLPLPAPSGISRRLVFFRTPGRPFGEDEKSAARVLRPHVVDALRSHGRRRAAAELTPRQRELLDLCAQGLDNTRLARTLGMSPGTVRKHLENAFARLDVRSRSEAVAATRPDVGWI